GPGVGLRPGVRPGRFHRPVGHGGACVAAGGRPAGGVRAGGRDPGGGGTARPPGGWSGGRGPVWAAHLLIPCIRPGGGRGGEGSGSTRLSDQQGWACGNQLLPSAGAGTRLAVCRWPRTSGSREAGTAFAFAPRPLIPTSFQGDPMRSLRPAFTLV